MPQGRYRPCMGRLVSRFAVRRTPEAQRSAFMQAHAGH